MAVPLVKKETHLHQIVKDHYMERMLQVFGFTVKHYLMVPSGKPIKNPIPYLGGRFRVYLLNVIPFAPPFGLAPAIHPMLLKRGETCYASHSTHSNNLVKHNRSSLFSRISARHIAACVTFPLALPF